MIDKNVTPTDLPAFLKSQELVPALYMYRGTSLIRNSPPPQEHCMALGMCFRRVLGKRCFLCARYPCTAGAHGRALRRALGREISLCTLCTCTGTGTCTSMYMYLIYMYM